MHFYLFLLISLLTISGAYANNSTSITTNTTNILDILNNLDLSKLTLYLILVVVIIIIILFLLYKTFSFISAKVEDIKIGSFSMKLKKGEVSTSKKEIINNIIDLNSIFNLFEMMTNAEVKIIINDTVLLMKDIHSIEDEYDKDVKYIFEKTFSIIESDLHDKLVSLACKITGFDLINIKNTREYFFICDLLNEYGKMWMKDAKDITRRNGFVEFLTDRTKSEPYITELSNAINQCIDMSKLESTDISKSNIDGIISESYKDYHSTLENMFFNLATLKSKMLKKREDKMNHIEGNIDGTSKKIIEEVKMYLFKKINDGDVNQINGNGEEKK